MDIDINTQANVLKDDLLAEITAGLRSAKKYLPSKLFYDEEGSRLFEEICSLKEYYPTRTEMQIMQDNIDDIARTVGGSVLLIEFGSGSSTKTRMLLDNLKNIQGYIPVDISSDHLMESVKKLKREYRDLNITPVAADYTINFNLPAVTPGFHKKVAYFPGSTIGNFTPAEAGLFMKRIASITGAGGELLIGIDLKKDTATLEAAYNDSQGITAKFNLNILSRINNEFAADFNPNNFKHFSFYNLIEGRIEMHLVCTENCVVNINDESFYFTKGETILTEYSYKYSIDEFRKLAEDTFRIKQTWTDEEMKFAVICLEAL